MTCPASGKALSPGFAVCMSTRIMSRCARHFGTGRKNLPCPVSGSVIQHLSLSPSSHPLYHVSFCWLPFGAERNFLLPTRFVLWWEVFLPTPHCAVEDCGTGLGGLFRSFLHVLLGQELESSMGSTIGKPILRMRGEAGSVCRPSLNVLGLSCRQGGSPA